MTTLSRKDLLGHGIELREFAGDTRVEYQKILLAYPSLPKDGIIVESFGGVKEVVILSEEMEITAYFSKWYASIPKDRRTKITHKLSESVHENFENGDVLEDWRDDIGEVMHMIGTFTSTNYSMQMYVSFENFIKNTKMYKELEKGEIYSTFSEAVISLKKEKAQNNSLELAAKKRLTNFINTLEKQELLVLFFFNSEDFRWGDIGRTLSEKEVCIIKLDQLSSTSTTEKGSVLVRLTKALEGDHDCQNLKDISPFIVSTQGYVSFDPVHIETKISKKVFGLLKEGLADIGINFVLDTTEDIPSCVFSFMET